MRAVVCVDDKGGMMFGTRRQSRDRVLIADVIEMTNGEKLYIAPYSKLLFEETDACVTVDEDMLDIAGKNDCCFVENKALLPYIDKLDELVIYRWNRHYPATLYLDIDPAEHGYKLVSTYEFAGSSHEKITKEIYRK